MLVALLESFTVFELSVAFAVFVGVMSKITLGGSPRQF